jgi:hypothetical protein
LWTLGFSFEFHKFLAHLNDCWLLCVAG